MCRILDARLRQDGLRKLVKLNLSDNSDGGTGNHHFLQACTEKLANTADLFNSHAYIFGYTTPNSTILNWERTNVLLTKAAGKHHFVGEFGSNQTVGATKQLDINRYERGILMARIVINLLNAGACGASYWSLLDQYYSKQEALSHDNMQQLGLWKYLRNDYMGDSINKDIHKDYEVRPQYFAFGMLSRFVQPNSIVYPILTRNEWVAATALRKAKNYWTYLFANPLKEDIRIDISNTQLHGTKKFKIYQYLRHSLPQNDMPIKASATCTQQDGHLIFSLPASSFVILEQE
jgi:alpha-galactosidase